ncbi:putative MFS family arabinose efflux permease [Krasilnikovia cinnamomea]|uniref:Putative MFS family arabinose efflux permease n=1 Tax=Krasilnikovia cinnamomea TaxID=349313 RepID=A0A4Q7ZRB3_9ACTN|nr:MFS transporter [Krasilnikovia cinnamomea]RZU53354.1 putative MFS family arabinose efflux permease [Krasilnikovia cinnamomea]
MTQTQIRPPKRTATGWGRVSLLLAGQGTSLVGDQVFFIAVVWAAAELGGTAAVTWVTLAESVPRALAMIFGGAVCDAFGPRAVLLRTTGVRVGVLAAASAVALTAESVPLLVAVAAVEGALLGLGTPSFGSLMPRMVPAAELGRANSLRTMVGRFAPIVGSPFGAWLVATGHLAGALAVVCVGCAVSLGCLLPATRALTPPPPTTGPRVPLWRRSGDGLALLRHDRRLRMLFLSSLCLDVAFAWPMNPGLPAVMIDRGWGVAAVGILIACWAVGALASAGLGALLGDRIPVPIRLVGGATGIAILLTVMIFAPTLPLMAAVAAALGFCSGQNGPAAVTLYQQAAPPDRLGAAMALVALSGIGCAPLAYAAIGALASLTSPTVAWTASALVAVGGPVAAARALRIPPAQQ